MSDELNVNTAYGLKSTDDHRQLYADWAETYDTTFKQATDYRLHEIVGNTHADANQTGPILDVGAGTGLVGEVLSARDLHPIDATDLSPEMLEVAGKKSVYRRLIEADLFKGIPVDDETYHGITCAGTFTLGHVGPDVLPELLRVAAPNALFTISVNAKHYRDAGFETALQGLAPQINQLSLTEVGIYGSDDGGGHGADTAFIVSFRKI